LLKALKIAEGEIAGDVKNALAQVAVTQSSPLFNKKGIM
jgi:hypothetical protein